MGHPCLAKLKKTIAPTLSKLQVLECESCQLVNACLVRHQSNVELVRIDFLMHKQYVFCFQNQLKGKKFTLLLLHWMRTKYTKICLG